MTHHSTMAAADGDRPSTGNGQFLAKIPRSHIVTSAMGFGPIPFTKVIATHAMVGEAIRRPRGRAGDALTHHEATVRAGVEKAAQRLLDKAVVGPIESQIKTVKALYAEINMINGAIANFQEAPILGPTGERYTYQEAKQAHDAGREEIAEAARTGSKANLIQPRRKVSEIGQMLIDFPVFLFAMFGLLNVNLRLLGGDFATNIRAGIAAVFALLGTVLIAVVMRTMGRRHRAFKGADGSIEAAGRASRAIRFELAALVLLVAAAAAVMASRVSVEGLTAEANPVLIAALAGMFAVLIGFAAYINYRAEYDNGSPLTDRVHHLSLKLRARDHQLNGVTAARQMKVEQAGVNTAKLSREITKASSRATCRVTSSANDKAIQLARGYHGLNPQATLPEPALDCTGIDLAAEQALQLAEHQKYLECGRPTSAPADGQCGTINGTSTRLTDHHLLTLLDTSTDHTEA